MYRPYTNLMKFIHIIAAFIGYAIVAFMFITYLPSVTKLMLLTFIGIAFLVESVEKSVERDALTKNNPETSVKE